MTKKQKWAATRAALYVIGSASLKVLGVHGLVTDEESQVYLLLLSGVFDLALLHLQGLRSESNDVGV